jgi:hypothetical protein
MKPEYQTVGNVRPSVPSHALEQGIINASASIKVH